MLNAHDEFILNIVVDPEFERKVLCSNVSLLQKLILKRSYNHKVSSKMLPLQDYKFRCKASF